MDQTPDKKLRRGFPGAPAAAGGSGNKQLVPLLTCSLRGRAGSLQKTRMSADPGVGQGGVLGGLPAPSVVLSAGGRLPRFCSRLFRSGSGGFGLSVSRPELAPTAHSHGCCWSVMGSLCFVAGGDVCPGASPASEGPSLSLETLMSQGNRGFFEGNLMFLAFREQTKMCSLLLGCLKDNTRSLALPPQN